MERWGKTNFYKKLPQTPGVYIMKDARGRILYIGKAANLKRRVASYFSRAPAYRTGRHEARIEKLVREIAKIEYRETETVIEALVLEAKLIKQYLPPYNIKEKDDKSFLFVEIAREEWPRILLVRGKDRDPECEHFGPFTSAASIREALKILRRIFPYNTHAPQQIGKYKRPCLDYELGLCPGTCAGSADKKEYATTLRHLKLFFTGLPTGQAGGKKKIIATLKKEMVAASKREEYERATKLKSQIFALTHIQDAALIGDEQNENWELKIENSAKRLEGYDISNTSGTSAVGSMVVFAGGVPDKSQYRKFKIRTVKGANDVAMLREVLTRRFENKWPLPDLILVDGGLSQLNAARGVLAAFKLQIPLVGLAKGPDRKNNALVGLPTGQAGDKIPAWTKLATLIRLRDEAHRFAISYHRQLRGLLH